jgi:hypothetical protein
MIHIRDIRAKDVRERAEVVTRVVIKTIMTRLSIFTVIILLTVIMSETALIVHLHADNSALQDVLAQKYPVYEAVCSVKNT